MTTTTPSSKIGPALDDLIAFRKATSAAMDAVNEVRDLIIPGTHAEGAWDAVVNLINELQGVYVDGHPCWVEFCDLDLGY